MKLVMDFSIYPWLNILSSTEKIHFIFHTFHKKTYISTGTTITNSRETLLLFASLNVFINVCILDVHVICENPFSPQKFNKCRIQCKHLWTLIKCQVECTQRPFIVYYMFFFDAHQQTALWMGFGSMKL